MKLNTILTSGSWVEMADLLNDNFSKIAIAIDLGIDGDGGGGITIYDVEKYLEQYKYTTQDDVSAMLSPYVLKREVTPVITDLNTRVASIEMYFSTEEESDNTINKWNEIVAFLDGIKGDTLDNILVTKADKATTLAGYGVTDAYTKTEADGKYFPKGGGMIYGYGADLLGINRIDGPPAIVFYHNNTTMGRLGFNTTGDAVAQIGGEYKTILHSGHIGKWDAVPFISQGGIMEVGIGIDFHTSKTDGSDYSTRIYSKGNYANEVILPSKSGTLALIDDIPTKLSQLTDDVVAGKYLPLSGGTITSQLRFGKDLYENAQTLIFRNASTTVDYGTVIVNQWDSGKTVFTLDRNSVLFRSVDNVENLILHSGNYSDYTLPITGGTVNGSITISDTSWARQLSLKTTSTDAGIRFYINESMAGILFTNVLGRLQWGDANKSYDIIHSNNIGSYNAGSATKLTTPRTIWGKSFDGSGDVGGDMHLNTSSIYWHHDKANYCLESVFREDASPFLKIAHYGGIRFDTLATARMCIKSNGNVGIGTETPAEKLEVNGNVKATTFIGNLTGNANSTSRLKYVEVNANQGDLNTILAGGGIAYNYYGPASWINAPTGAQYGSCVQFQPRHNHAQLSGQLLWDVNHNSSTDTTRSLWWRASDINEWTNSKWHQIAFTDSNVASATKLETPRAIWGQNFDGSSDVVGDLILQSVTAVGRNSDSAIIRFNGNGYDSGDIVTGPSIRSIFSGYYGRKRLAIFQHDADDYTIENEVVSVLPNGNVGIGTNTPTEKLHVNGNARIDGSLTVSGGVNDYEERIAALEEKTKNL